MPEGMGSPGVLNTGRGVPMVLMVPDPGHPGRPFALCPMVPKPPATAPAVPNRHFPGLGPGDSCPNIHLLQGVIRRDKVFCVGV